MLPSGGPGIAFPVRKGAIRAACSLKPTPDVSGRLPSVPAVTEPRECLGKQFAVVVFLQEEKTEAGTQRQLSLGDVDALQLIEALQEFGAEPEVGEGFARGEVLEHHLRRAATRCPGRASAARCHGLVPRPLRA